jgi:hypothetical protein
MGFPIQTGISSDRNSLNIQPFEFFFDQTLQQLILSNGNQNGDVYFAPMNTSSDHDQVDPLGNETESTVTLTMPALTAAAGNVGLGNQVESTATAGGGQAVPSTVLGYLDANIGGVKVKIPYFSA